MLFQILDWNYFHDEDDDGNKTYKIRLFGRTKENKTIYVCVDNFYPYFYIGLDDNIKKNSIHTLVENIKKLVKPKELADGLLKYEVEEKKNLYGFTDGKLFKFLKLTFYNYDAFRAYERKLSYAKFKGKKYKLYESNIEPFLRCMHIQNLDAVGWVEIDENKLKYCDNSISCCDINISCNYTELKRFDDTMIMPFIIASFDIECESEDSKFPQPDRPNDRIIQIGTTFSRFGEQECYYKHIITLGKCKKLDNIDMVCCDTEEEVLLEWTKLIRKHNPDIITGYNIFGFDFQYMMVRAKKLGIEKKFSQLSRITNEECKWQEKKLASSALGENILKYYDMTGRVIIDLMKVVQRDHKLMSYKLDWVAQSFIKEIIQQMSYDNDKTIITTKNTYGVCVGQYVTVLYDDGITENKHMDGKKFRILELTKTQIIVDGIIDNDTMKNGYKTFWCQAKDDIAAKDIFEYQKKNPLSKKCKYRTIIAKYCVQDTELVSKLVSKLQVLTNNIGMANVCHVPLTYLFMRGQGIKIFSLVSRKCREENFVIPVLKKPKADKNTNKNIFEIRDGQLLDNFVSELNNKGREFEEEDDDEDNNFEGAIVFPPKKGVYFEPIPVLDYNSLYPSSMIQRNLSHECNVIDNNLDEKYGYLPNYKYHEITYNTTYIFNDIYKEFKKENQYIDFLRLILSIFIPKIKLDYTKTLNDENIINVSYKTEDNEYYDDILTIKDNNIKNNMKYIIKDSFKYLSAIIKLVMANVARLHNLFLNEKIRITHDKDKNMFIIHKTIFKKERLWIEIDYSFKNEKIVIYKTCKFAEHCDGTKGIIPRILIGLLDARKKYKNDMETEKDSFIKSILDGLQLAYKVTANSLYGQTGSPVSPIFMKDIAAATTATGRHMLQFSRYYIEEIYNTLINLALTDKNLYFDFAMASFNVLPYIVNSYGYDVPVHLEPNVKIPEKRWINPKAGWTNIREFFEKFFVEMNNLLKGYKIDAKIIYGDTDSVFFNPKIIDIKTNEIQKDKTALEISIQLGIWASETISKLLPEPQKQAYEKVLYPFAILTKKRYVGNLYETNPNKFYQKSMGIVLKRRDNAPIVKVVVGGIINEIMNNHSARGAVEYTKKILNQILTNKYSIDKYIITKTLKENYADRTRIVHAVLADRMAVRDPGNKPSPNDRIPYAYIQLNHEVELQGDRVEHPEYILKNNLKLDYLFYITNQIMKPSIQFLELLVKNPQDIFNEFILREKNRRKGFKPINFFLKHPHDNNNENNDDNDDTNNKDGKKLDDIFDLDNSDSLEQEVEKYKSKKTKTKSKK